MRKKPYELKYKITSLSYNNLTPKSTISLFMLEYFLEVLSFIIKNS